MKVLEKTAVACATISMLLPSLALAHAGHPVAGSFHSLLHGFEYVLLPALAAIVAARATATPGRFFACGKIATWLMLALSPTRRKG